MNGPRVATEEEVQEMGVELRTLYGLCYTVYKVEYPPEAKQAATYASETSQSSGAITDGERVTPLRSPKRMHVSADVGMHVNTPEAPGRRAEDARTSFITDRNIE